MLVALAVASGIALLAALLLYAPEKPDIEDDRG
jgi:hypothetical protein